MKARPLLPGDCVTGIDDYVFLYNDAGHDDHLLQGNPVARLNMISVGIIVSVVGPIGVQKLFVVLDGVGGWTWDEYVKHV